MYALAGFLGLIGFVFLAGSQHQIHKIVIGIVLLGGAIAIGWLTKAKAPERTIVQKVDLTGDIQKEQLECNSCGAPLDQKSISLQEGAILVNCPYCGTSYHLEEAPKW